MNPVPGRRPFDAKSHASANVKSGAAPRRSAFFPFLLAALGAAVLASCADAPTRPAGADELRARLSRLQADPDLGKRAPLAMHDADTAVAAAEQPQSDPVVGAHLVFMADRRIAIAQAMAENQLTVDQRKQLAERRAEMRLAERTAEADSANRRTAIAQAETGNQRRQADIARMDASDARTDANVARNDADSARMQADVAQGEASAARDATADANAKADDMRRQLEELEARPTDRGLVVTLGDVLFAFGTADINTGGNDHLNKLATFLTNHPDRTAIIEGYTDNVGSADYNLGLSQRRAEAVKNFLVAQGIATTRLSASGKGKDSPVGDNSSATGRQQNRRVEVVINNEVVSLR
jgi:outer membrane protein OmpA-like peptidoglycan-associated protein